MTKTVPPPDDSFVLWDEYLGDVLKKVLGLRACVRACVCVCVLGWGYVRQVIIIVQVNS